MMTNTANPTGETAFDRVAKSAVRGLIYGAIAVIIIYSIGYLFSIPVSISFVIIMALVFATAGAQAYQRYVWYLRIVWVMMVFTSTYIFFTYPDWRFGSISALVFVLLLTIAGAGWGGRWRGAAFPPRWFP